MNYRRVMRIPSLRQTAAPLMGVVLVLAGCAAEVLGAWVPLAMIEQGPAAVGGGFWTAAHPASTNTTPASGAAAFLKDGIRITRR